MVKNSPLIETFRRVHTSIRDNFLLVHRSVRHALPNLKTTLERLTELLQKHHAYESTHRVGAELADTEELVDHFRQGMLILQQEKSIQFGVETSHNDNENLGEASQNTEELLLDDIGNI